ncbi:MAG: translation initiation factor IF-3 [Polyangiaceae bacterium]|nr:translation initiation factor IF-3 [Polyangiaceae bacterium]
MRRRFRGKPREPQIRVNHRIRVPEVLVVGADGANLGVLQTQEALRKAREAGLDLVEINPKGQPPVCKILDFGKFKYEESKRKRETKRKQSVVEIKEVKLRPKTDEHDLDVKKRNSRRFIEAGNKVKIVCRFRGREITHPERARMQLDEIIAATEDIANVELRPTMEGRTMAMVIAPKPAILQRVAQEKVRREQERENVKEEERARGNQEKAKRRTRQENAEAERAANTKSIDELMEGHGYEYEHDPDDFDDELDDDEDLSAEEDQAAEKE